MTASSMYRAAFTVGRRRRKKEGRLLGTRCTQQAAEGQHTSGESNSPCPPTVELEVGNALDSP